VGCGGLVVGGTGTYRSIKERTARKAAEQGSVMMASRPVDPIGTSRGGVADRGTVSFSEG
jgi:hypothetical protein